MYRREAGYRGLVRKGQVFRFRGRYSSLLDYTLRATVTTKTFNQYLLMGWVEEIVVEEEIGRSSWEDWIITKKEEENLEELVYSVRVGKGVQIVSNSSFYPETGKGAAA
jgi:hypothetical protein